MNSAQLEASTSSSSADVAMMPPPLRPPPRPRVRSSSAGPPPPTGAKQLASQTPPMMDEEARLRLELRRARNRLAARKCRDKKFARIAELRAAIERVDQSNQAHAEEMAQLEARRDQLRRMIACLCYKSALGGPENETVANDLIASNTSGDILDRVDVQVVHLQDAPPKILLLTCLGTAFTLGPASPADLTPVEVTYLEG